MYEHMHHITILPIDFCTHSFQVNSTITAMSFYTLDNTKYMLAVGCDDGRLYGYDLNEKKKVYSVSQHVNRVTGVCDNICDNHRVDFNQYTAPWISADMFTR